MPLPQLIPEIDFTGNPTQTYYDQLFNTDGLVSYWRMADAATLTDALGVNSGTVVATPSLVTGALPYDSNQALSFNGTTQRAYVPSSSSLTPTNMTMQGFVKLPSLPAATRTLVGKHGTWVIQVSSTGIVSFTIKNDTTSSTVSLNAALATNTFYCITAIHDSDNGFQYIYSDGVLDQSAVWAGGREGNSRPIYFAANPSGTAPTYQSTQSATGTASASLTCNAPASIASGDLMIAQLQMHNGTGTITAEPSGWFLLGYAIDAGNHWTRIYYKIATGSEPASYTWTNSAGDNWVMAISRITGVDSIQAFANPAYGGATASSTTHSTGTHLPNVDNNMVVALFAQRGGTSFTEDSGTERYDLQAPGPTQTIAMCTQTQATAASINVTGTTLSGSVGSAFMLVLAGSGINTHTTASEDEWTFWNRALSAQEVAAQFQARLSGLGAWVNVGEGGSGDARSASTSIKRQYELNRMEAGTATVPLKNQHRRYDPANTSSVYYPNVKPNRKMRLRALLNGVYYPIFQGFIERWPSKWEVPNYDEVTLTLADGFKPLARAGVSGTLASGLSGTQINTVLNKAAWPTADRSIDTGLFTMAADTSTTTAFALAVIQDIADSELGIFYIAPNGQATFHDRSHRWTQTNSITSQATFSDAGSFIGYQGLVPSDDDDNTVSSWQVTTAAGVTSTATDVISDSENFGPTQTRATRLDNPSDAATQALALLQITAKPTLRFDSLTLKLTVATPSTVWVKALSLAISDRVTIIRSPVPSTIAAGTGSVITRDCFIEGIGWDITPDVWTVSWQLSPVSTSSYYDTVVRAAPVSFWLFDTTT